MNLTRELVGARYGAEQLAVMQPVLRAVATRLAHARIHFDDYRQLVTSHIEEPLAGGTSWWELMWGSEGQEIGANNYFFIATEAHVYACVQSLHAIADNLAHVLYYALGWNLEGTLPSGKVSLARVRDRLEQLLAVHPDVAPLHQELVALGQASSYRTLSDVVNHIKHHGGLPVRVSWEISGLTPYEMVLGPFNRQYEGHLQEHPPREISSYLEETHDLMNRSVIRIGRTLNAWLLERESAKLGGSAGAKAPDDGEALRP